MGEAFTVLLIGFALAIIGAVYFKLCDDKEIRKQEQEIRQLRQRIHELTELLVWSYWIEDYWRKQVSSSQEGADQPETDQEGMVADHGCSYAMYSGAYRLCCDCEESRAEQATKAIVEDRD